MSNALNNLYDVVMSRKELYTNSGFSAEEAKKNSYTCYLFSQGENKILKKCGEECSEMIIASKNNDKVELKNEIADLMYHIMVLCGEKNLPWSEVEEVLDERAKKIGNLKVFHQTDKDS